MHTTTVDPQAFEKHQRTFLRDEGRKAYHRHVESLQKHFHIVEDTPMDVDDVVQRIKDGKFTLVPKEDRDTWDSWRHHIIWRTEDQKRDPDGMKAANKKLDAAWEHFTQDVMILPLDKALKSVRDFEKETFH